MSEKRTKADKLQQQVEKAEKELNIFSDETAKNDEDEKGTTDRGAEKRLIGSRCQSPFLPQ